MSDDVIFGVRMLLGSDFRPSISGLRNDLLPFILPCSRDTIESECAIGGRCDPEGGGFIGGVVKNGTLFFGDGNGVEEEDSEVIVAPATEEFADDKG